MMRGAGSGERGAGSEEDAVMGEGSGHEEGMEERAGTRVAVTAQVRREQALELLAMGMPPVYAARTLGISMRTLRRYLQNGALLAELRRMQTEWVEALLRSALTAAPHALEALHAIATNPASSERSRVSAARAVIENSLRLYESIDLAQRVERLEELAEEVDEGQRQEWRVVSSE